MQVDIAAARTLVLGMMVVVRPGIVAWPVAQHLQAPARGEPAAGQRLGEGAERRRAQEASLAVALRRFHAGFAPAFKADRPRTAGLGQSLAVVVTHARD